MPHDRRSDSSVARCVGGSSLANRHEPMLSWRVLPSLTLPRRTNRSNERTDSGATPHSSTDSKSRSWKSNICSSSASEYALCGRRISRRHSRLGAGRTMVESMLMASSAGSAGRDRRKRDDPKRRVDRCSVVDVLRRRFGAAQLGAIGQLHLAVRQESLQGGQRSARQLLDTVQDADLSRPCRGQQGRFRPFAGRRPSQQQIRRRHFLVQWKQVRLVAEFLAKMLSQYALSFALGSDQQHVPADRVFLHHGRQDFFRSLRGYQTTRGLLLTFGDYPVSATRRQNSHCFVRAAPRTWKAAATESEVAHCRVRPALVPRDPIRSFQRGRSRFSSSCSWTPSFPVRDTCVERLPATRPRRTTDPWSPPPDRRQRTGRLASTDP